MDSPLKIEEFKQLLFKKTGYIKEVRGGEEIVTFCPWCETNKFGRSDPEHFYINVNSLKINCYRANCTDSRGMIFKLITKLGGNPKDYITDSSILSNWKNYIRTRRTKESFDIEEYDYKENIDISEMVKLKTQYLQQRLGITYDIEKIDRLVFSIKKFLAEKKIFISDKDKNIIDFLDRNFVGVIGNRGTIVNLRNIETSDFRHFNLSIKDKAFFKDFYGIRTGPIRKEKNTIVLCEGIFDLLVAIDSNELKHLKKDTCFWACGFGTGYINTLFSVLDYIKIPQARLIILSDSNMDIDKYKYISKNPFIESLEVYWNKYKKDFGETPIELVKVSY